MPSFHDIQTLYGETFGRWLRRQRYISGMTRQALATRAGLSVEAVAKLERDEREPLLSTAIKLYQSFAHNNKTGGRK